LDTEVYDLRPADYTTTTQSGNLVVEVQWEAWST